jgi:hypothetical protein
MQMLFWRRSVTSKHVITLRGVFPSYSNAATAARMEIRMAVSSVGTKANAALVGRRAQASEFDAAAANVAVPGAAKAMTSSPAAKAAVPIDPGAASKGLDGAGTAGFRDRAREAIHRAIPIIADYLPEEPTTAADLASQVMGNIFTDSVPATNERITAVEGVLRDYNAANELEQEAVEYLRAWLPEKK